MKVLKNGFLTGLTLQIAIGPIFFFIVNLTLQRTILDGFVAVCAVTIVDYLYILLAILGIGKILELDHVKKIFAIVSSSVLMVFAVFIIRKAFLSGTAVHQDIRPSTLLNSFSSVFLLTLSSPLTIVFFSSLFATKAIEYHYSKRELVLFGFATGFATLTFLSLSVLFFHFIGGYIPIFVIKALNVIVGCVLFSYGILRLVKVLKNRM